jgi:hypothetical protein
LNKHKPDNLRLALGNHQTQAESPGHITRKPKRRQPLKNILTTIRKESKMLEKLKTLPADKIPPCAIYSELVKLTGLRNGWTCKQWIDYLKKGF